MKYREFGNSGIWLSGLGLGMNRFDVHSDTEDNFAQAVDVVEYAIKRGINYIDVAKNYSNQMAFPILKKALQRVQDEEVHICLKIMLNHTDGSKEMVLQNLKEQLDAIDIPKADFCFAQAVKSYEEYKQIIRKGGIYEGFAEAKERGFVQNICFSSHASVEDTIKIMEEGLFEGITISYHLLNCIQMNPVLEKAKELGMGVLTMNSLAGGLIPQNPQLFYGNDIDKVCKDALQFIYCHKEVTCVLSGMKSKEEVDCNISAIVDMPENTEEVPQRVLKDIFQKNGLCTGCNYCEGCPKGIPIKDFMYSYNALQFNNQIYAKQYQRKDTDLLNSIRITQELMHRGMELPVELQNPCIKCKACEKKCTQSLPITERLQAIYHILDHSLLSVKALYRRIEELNLIKYDTVAFYPNCASTKILIKACKEFFNGIPFKTIVLDRNQELWGQTRIEGIPVAVMGLDVLEKKELECIILTHYILSDTLYYNIKKYEKDGIEIKCLYGEEDVPLVYLGG